MMSTQEQLAEATSSEKARMLCEACAEEVYDRRAPNMEYARRTARLLYMTGAHESGGWRWRRQVGYPRSGWHGAFGLWQCEAGSIRDSLRWLRTRPAVIHHAAAYLKPYGQEALMWAMVAGWEDFGRMLLSLQKEEGDPMSCLLARLHYFRVREPIPAGDEAMAKYAKKYYNTYKGKAKASDYLNAFNTYWPGDDL